MTTLDTAEDLGDSDEDFTELESLLSPPKPEVDGLDELEELLGEAMAAKLDADKVKLARAKAKSGFSNTPDDLERIRKWELANEWRPAANVAFFERSQCSCGKHHTVFRQLMLRQVGRLNPNNNRWTVLSRENDIINAKLPKETAMRITKVPICPACCADTGYSLSSHWTW